MFHVEQTKQSLLLRRSMKGRCATIAPLFAAGGP
jgi:hypothetical protein